MIIPEVVRQGAQYGIATLLTGVLAYAAVNDVRERKIPNWTVLACLALFVAWAIVHPLNWDLWALGAGVIAFAVTFGLYMGWRSRGRRLETVRGGGSLLPAWASWRFWPWPRR